MQHLAVTEAAGAGLRAVPGASRAFAAAQAAWRFYANQETTLPTLFEPLLAHAREAVAEACQRYVLVAHDWSDVGYATHASKRDRIAVTHRKDLGYDLQTALLISDATGAPLAPAYLGLRSATGVHTTRRVRPLPPRPHLSEIGRVMRHVSGLRLRVPCVHIVDQEGDSVLHLRRWSRCEQTFLVRCDGIRLVLWRGQEVLVSALVEALGAEMRHVGEVALRGAMGQQYVAETEVELHRPAKVWRTTRDGTKRRAIIKGRRLRLRLLVSQVRAPGGAVVAQWLLWTNLPEAVGCKQAARWYYWRWRIESYFKLVKRAGHHLENWQQETSEAVAKRLVIASHACVIVWQVARAQEPEAEPVRELLLRLSGRLMKRGTSYTEPALLAGFFVLLALLDALERYSVDDLRRLADLALPKFVPLPDG